MSFTPEGALRLQSRGHYLTGGPRERHFHLFKAWAGRYAQELWDVLGSRYIMYGEWLYAKHAVFYTNLPHYFLEFDILDTDDGTFLSTERRKDLLRQAPFVVPVRVLHAGTLATLIDLQAFIGPSHFIRKDSPAQLRALCERQGIDPDLTARETDLSGMMEGLYIKVEEDGVVTERYKFVRGDFLQSVLDSGNHWLDRPIVPNQLSAGVEIF